MLLLLQQSLFFFEKETLLLLYFSKFAFLLFKFSCTDLLLGIKFFRPHLLNLVKAETGAFTAILVSLRLLHRLLLLFLFLLLLALGWLLRCVAHFFQGRVQVLRFNCRAIFTGVGLLPRESRIRCLLVRCS